MINERFFEYLVKVFVGNDNLKDEGKIIKCLILFFVLNNVDEVEYFWGIEFVYNYVL